MSLAAIVKALSDAGCTSVQIAAAVLAHEAEQQAAEEKKREARRSGTRERVRAFRDRQRNACNAVTYDSNALPPSPKERSPIPPKEITPPPESLSLPSRLPADFEIGEEDRAFGRAQGLSDLEIDRSVEDMRLWAAEAIGEKALRSDWHATAKRFMRRDADAAKKGGKGRQPKVVSASTEDEPSGVRVKRDSPQGDAWWVYKKATTGRSWPVDRDGGWLFDSEWPPDHPNFKGSKSDAMPPPRVFPFPALVPNDANQISQQPSRKRRKRLKL